MIKNKIKQKESRQGKPLTAISQHQSTLTSLVDNPTFAIRVRS